MRGAGRYAVLEEAAKAAPQLKSKELFSMHISAINKEGEIMDDEARFLVNLLFKPIETALKLRPAETQLLLAHFGEILKEFEVEHQAIIEEEKSNPSLPSVGTEVP